MLKEMNHRVKNLFSLASSVVALSARSGGSPAELAATIQDRLGALARAHSLTLSIPSAVPTEPPATLHGLIKAIVSPYDNRAAEEPERVTVSGADIPLSPDTLPSLALLFHELTTNAAKYGALSTPEGHVDIRCEAAGDRFLVQWTEHGGPPVDGQPGADGFGGRLMRTAVEGQFGGAIARDWLPQGLTIRLSLALDRLAT